LPAKAVLLQDPDRRAVARHDARLHPMEAEDVEGERQGLADGFGGVPAAVPLLRHPISERGVLPEAAMNHRQLHQSHDGRRIGLLDGERMAGPGRPVGLGPGQAVALALQREEPAVAMRLERLEERSVRPQPGHERGRVRGHQRPDPHGRTRGDQKSASSFTAAYTRSSSGMNTCSSAAENGMAGMSGPAIRATGASRSNMHSSAMVAEISAPAPYVRLSSYRTNAFPV